jgi:hypothetical protein
MESGACEISTSGQGRTHATNYSGWETSNANSKHESIFVAHKFLFRSLLRVSDSTK